MRRIALVESSPTLRLRLQQFLVADWPEADIESIDPTPEYLKARRTGWEGYDVLVVGLIEDPVAALDFIYRLKQVPGKPAMVFLVSLEQKVKGSEALLAMARASLPREDINRFDLSNTLRSLSGERGGAALDTSTRAITEHMRVRAQQTSAPVAQYQTSGKLQAFPTLAPRIAIIEGTYGSRTLLSLFLRTRWPNAVVDAIDPFVQSARDVISVSGFDADLLIIGCIGTLAEAETTLARLRARQEPPAVILLIGVELENAVADLLAVGAHVVLMRDRLSARDLVDAASRLLRTPGENPVVASPARGAFPDPDDFGSFPLVVHGTRRDIAIAGYRLLEKLAGNEHNHVFFAERIRDHRRAVIKVMNGTPLEHRKLLHAFIEIYVYLTAKDDRRLVKVLDAGIAGDYPYLAFEYLSAGDLRRALTEVQAPAEALRIFTAIVDALQVLHADSFAHMDIKPENVFFRDDGGIVLIDFTLATRFGSIAGMKTPGEVMGSPFYMSPEHGQGLPVDGRADLYSAGVLLYEMLTGERLYQAESAAALIYHHIHDEIPLLPQHLRQLQPLLDGLLAKQPADRFATAPAVLAAVPRFTP